MVSRPSRQELADPGDEEHRGLHLLPRATWQAAADQDGLPLIARIGVGRSLSNSAARMSIVMIHAAARSGAAMGGYFGASETDQAAGSA